VVELVPQNQPVSRRLVAGLVALLILGQWSAAMVSLLGENPTVDEVVHLPAGISYWQTGSFEIYPHNPPLVKLIAALPVLAAGPVTDPLYGPPAPGKAGTIFGLGWATGNKAAFAHEFMELNAPRLLDLCSLGRLVMPTFGALGGLIVFFWARALYGDRGGLVALALWAACPNILAHTRLITTDVASTTIGFGATFAFWRYLKKPGWGRAALAGAVLGVAQITKFSALMLYGLWPLMWVIEEMVGRGAAGRLGRLGRAIGHGLLVVVLSVLVIDAGYGFKGIGKPLGDFRFTSRALTKERERPIVASRAGRMEPDLEDGLLQYRKNRFQGTILGDLPAPLPVAYLTGFDDQKMEAEGIPPKAMMFADDPRTRHTEAEETRGYPVFLDGELASKSWWYYYVMALLYKVPEGTWALVLGSIAAGFLCNRCRARPEDEAALWVFPLTMLGVMSFGTNIALGLRYVLPIFPYVFVSAGKLGPWSEGSRWRTGAVCAGLLTTLAATASIHPSYLAYFNWASGGPDRGSEHLIDSNLDWGQDLVKLRDWVAREIPGEKIGLAYFGQIPPGLLGEMRGGGMDWFLPPALPGTFPSRPDLEANAPRPGWYAVSASLVRGLPWRVYGPERIAPYEAKERAFSYFSRLEPALKIGHSIFLYKLTPADAERLGRLWRPR
jgi:hypothetical protein